MFPRLVPAVAIVALAVTAAPANAQEDPVMTLAEALDEASSEGWTIIDAAAEGAAPYQYGDDPTNPAQLDVPYGQVEQAAAGLFLFGDGVAVDCTDPAQLCSPGFEAPAQDDIYIGFSMTMAGEIPVDGAEGNVINYSFPWRMGGEEPFIELDAFPGDTWQDMSQVIVAESRPPFTLTRRSWEAGSFPEKPTLTFGLVNGDQIWVFVPIGLQLDVDIKATIEQVLDDPGRDGSVPLPQALADALSRSRWGAAVHIHRGDFGAEQPSMITALPPTPREPGSGFEFPTSITRLGDGPTVFIPPATPEPEPVTAVDTTSDDPPADETPADDRAVIATDSTDPGSGPPILPIAVGGVAVVSLTARWILLKRSGDDDEAAEITDEERAAHFMTSLNNIPDSIRAPDTETNSYVREDGTKVDWWGVPGHAQETTYTYKDGTVRVDSGSTLSRDVKITRRDGSVEHWFAQDWPDDRRDRVTGNGYIRTDAEGKLLESGGWDTKDPPAP